ncbi:ABC transporter permease [soil metagenome]
MTTTRDAAPPAVPATPPQRHNPTASLLSRIAPQSPSQIVQRVMLAVLVLSVLVLCIANGTFRQPDNLLNIVQQASMVGVIACGMQLMIISGGFDLSVGIVAAGAGCAAAYVSLSQGVLVGIVVGLVVGLLAGVANGVLIAKVGINPFVATFGTQAVVTGILYAATDATPIAPLPVGWTDLGLKSIGGISLVSITFLIVVLILLFVLRATVFGQHIYAIGSNKEGARRAGIHVDRVLIAVYGIGGLCAAIAGLLLVGVSGIGSPSTGTQWALLAIAAVIIGGTPLTGGVGGISSAVIGILSLTVLTNALNIYSVSAYWQPALTGTAVLLAVGFEAFRSVRKR